MIKWIKRKFENYIVSIVEQRLQPWGHCGICGKPINNELFDKGWAWGICEECKGKEIEEKIKE